MSREVELDLWFFLLEPEPWLLLGSSYHHPAIPTQLTNSITCQQPNTSMPQECGEQSQRKRQSPNKGGMQVWISMMCLESGRGHHPILQIEQSLPKHTPVHVYQQIHPAWPHRGTSVRRPTWSLCTVKLSSAHLLPTSSLIPKTSRGLPWWLRSTGSTCQCRRHRFNSWSGKIPHASEQHA